MSTGISDPIVEARRKIVSRPPLRNQKLSEAAKLLSQKRDGAAETITAKFLEKNPSDPAALGLMADIAQRAGRFEDATRLLTQAIERDPDNARYRFNVAIALGRLDQAHSGLEHIDTLLSREPDNPACLSLKGALLHQVGRHDEAVPLYWQMTMDYPQSAEAWLSLGSSMRLAGDPGQCVAIFRKALELSPGLGIAYLALADLNAQRFTAEDSQWMETELKRSGLSAQDRTNLHFALGTAYNSQQEHAKAFENYSKANALRRLTVESDPQRLATHSANCRRVFTAQSLQAKAGSGNASRSPIFIVGMPRSGSTLVEQILSSHSQIEGLGEIEILDRVIALRNDPLAVSRLGADDLRALGDEYLRLAQARRRTTRPYFTDKTLSNFGQIGFIQLILPNAKIADVRRHPLDCGWSCFKSHFPKGMPFSHRLGDIGQHYANYVGLMAHFDAVMPGKVHRIIYEELVSDPEASVPRLFDYLELAFEPQTLRSHDNKRVVATLSTDQVRKPLNKSGLDQWRPYDTWLGPLKSALGPVLESYPRPPN